MSMTRRAISARPFLAGNFTNFFRTVCLWTLAFSQTFNFYGLMLNSPIVFRKTQYYDNGEVNPNQVGPGRCCSTLHGMPFILSVKHFVYFLYTVL